MSSNPFVGTWTYRSFHNKPEDVDDFNAIRLWQATLTLEADGPHLVRGKIGTGGYDLNIRGSVSTDHDTPTIKLRAVGIDGTATAGWVYDYVGVLAPSWPEGDDQRPAIVGTVIRTVPHDPNRQAGLSYSFVAVNKTVPPAPYQLPEKVIAHFADRMHRLHHAVWHGIRNDWNSLTKQQQESIDALGWSITGDRVALLSPAQKTRPLVTNGSGEDFLFFHRQMVVQYKKLMSEAGATPVEWPEIPQPGAGGPDGPKNVVPSSWAVPVAPNFERRLAALKSDEYYWSRMRWWDYQYKDPTYLATLTLGELGSLIEFSVHNDMHIRWSAPARHPDTNVLLPLGRPSHENDKKWDNTIYDWLGEFYSSHVNPVFWRLHGWIDDRIEDWYAAHQWKHSGEVKRVEKGGVQWFEQGRWVQVQHPWVWPESLGGYQHGHGDGHGNGHGGGHGHAHSEGHDHDHGDGGHDPDLRAKRIASAEKVMAILYPPPSKEKDLTERVAPGLQEVPPRTSIVGF